MRNNTKHKKYPAKELDMDQVENNGAAASKFSRMSRERKIMLGLVAALLTVGVGMYGWKVAAVNAVENRLAQVEAEQAEAQAQIINQAKQLEDARVEEALRLFSIPFAWAIRRELMAGNVNQVDQYLGQLVQIRGFESAVLANPDGKVIVASDRKKLVETFSSLYPGVDLSTNEIKLEKAGNGTFRAIIPILGLNKHLGVVVLEYRLPAHPPQ
jgi:type II secretory pathway component PulM